VSKIDVEALKRESNGLRGTIPEELADAIDHFSEEAVSLLKFHGTYQQDDRDARKTARETGAGKDYSFMVRTKNPGGFLPSAFYAAIDELAGRFGNGTIRVTTRSGLQLHGIRKTDLKTVIAEINTHVGSTLGACGDINRNVMAPPFPFAAPAYVAARAAANAIAELLTPRATAYYEVWQDGEVVHSTAPAADEPIYGPTFLPRKFKIAVTVPGDNAVDLYTNDLGIVVLADEHGITGYNVTVGGGLGMTHGKKQTYPRLADEFGFVGPDQLLEVVRAIVIVQRDYGDRTNRKHARLKYLIDDRGLEWFRDAVEAEAGFALEPWRELPAWTVPAYDGWHPQGDGRWFYGLEILSGRIRDGETERVKSALRAIVDRTGRDLIATPNQNILIIDVEDAERATIDAIFRDHGVGTSGGLDAFARNALACPALPTCGLSLAESERVLPAVLDGLRAAWAAAELGDGVPTVRMTGCPNGCARPFMGEIGIVGTSLDRYNVYLGGNPSSTRLNLLYREKIPAAEIGNVLAPLFASFAAGRLPGESFGDYCARARVEQLAS
jgi:sulfite reductase (ferredoxin)